MIHVFHGFLGSPEDFSFLAGAGVTLHDLHDLDLKTFEVSPDDTLVGYSMGGRIALELAQRVNFQVKRLVLMNAHPGLEDLPAREERRRWEEEVVQRLGQESFLSYWNALPVFAADAPLAPISQEIREKNAELFKRFRLSEQENFLPKLRKDNVLWLIGSRDEKYVSLAEKRLLPNGLPVRIIPAGHRLFQHPELVKKVLQEEGIL